VADSIQHVLALVLLADMAIMLAIGGRLLFAAARSRRAPEAAIGMSAAFGALGVLLSVTATTIFARDPAFFPLWAAGRLAHAAGACALGIGCWRIYRSEEATAAMCSAMACAVAMTGCAIRVIPGTIPPPGEASVGVLLSGLAPMIVYGWASVEALRYHLQLRRRMTLGLSDPLMAHRFLLWAISGTCAFATAGAGTLFTMALRTPLSSNPVAFGLVQLGLFVASLALWLAFFPPAFYRHGVLARAARATS
jgi:hypothetical protein